MRTKLTSLVVVLSLGGATAAAAQPMAVRALAAEPMRQAAVGYQELDLTSWAGVNALQGRIDIAAQRVCGPEPSMRQLNDHRMYASCLTAAKASTAEPVSLAIARAQSERSDPTLLAKK